MSVIFMYLMVFSMLITSCNHQVSETRHRFLPRVRVSYFDFEDFDSGNELTQHIQSNNTINATGSQVQSDKCFNATGSQVQSDKCFFDGGCDARDYVAVVFVTLIFVTSDGILLRYLWSNQILLNDLRWINALSNIVHLYLAIYVQMFVDPSEPGLIVVGFICAIVIVFLLILSPIFDFGTLDFVISMGGQYLLSKFVQTRIPSISASFVCCGVIVFRNYYDDIKSDLETWLFKRPPDDAPATALTADQSDIVLNIDEAGSSSAASLTAPIPPRNLIVGTSIASAPPFVEPSSTASVVDSFATSSGALSGTAITPASSSGAIAQTIARSSTTTSSSALFGTEITPASCSGVIEQTIARLSTTTSSGALAGIGITTIIASSSSAIAQTIARSSIMTASTFPPSGRTGALTIAHLDVRELLLHPEVLRLLLYLVDSSAAASVVDSSAISSTVYSSTTIMSGALSGTEITPIMASSSGAIAQSIAPSGIITASTFSPSGRTGALTIALTVAHLDLRELLFYLVEFCISITASCDGTLTFGIASTIAPMRSILTIAPSRIVQAIVPFGGTLLVAPPCDMTFDSFGDLSDATLPVALSNTGASGRLLVAPLSDIVASTTVQFGSISSPILFGRALTIIPIGSTPTIAPFRTTTITASFTVMLTAIPSDAPYDIVASSSTTILFGSISTTILFGNILTIVPFGSTLTIAPFRGRLTNVPFTVVFAVD